MTSPIPVDQNEQLSWVRRHLAYRHAYLFVSVFAVVVVGPLSTDLFSGATLEIILGFTLLAGAFATARYVHELMYLLSISVVLAVVRLGTYWTGHEGLWQITLLLYIAAYSAFCWLILRSLFETDTQISSDTIFGAISVYMLIGLIWAMMYWLLELQMSGSFRYESPGSHDELQRLIGFSYATLTTVGYGNISPANPQADALATLEGMVGQIYIAVVIARLVAIQVIQRTRANDTDSNEQRGL